MKTKTYYLLFILPLLLIFLITCEKDDNNDPENSVSTKFTITPEGGEYNFENGIKLDVPEDAVSEETEIEIKYADLTDDGIISIFNKRGITFNDCYAIIEAKPDGLIFNNPVTVTIPVELAQGAFPSAYEYDLENGTYTPSMTDISYNLEEGIIELALSHFSTHSVEQIKELKKAEEYCEENPCRCEGADIKQTDNDEICKSTECQVTDFKVTATYPEKCGGTTEMYIVSEIGDDCEPELTLSANEITISVGEKTDITAEVDFICNKLPSQEVTYSVTSLGSLSTDKNYTNDDGKASVTFTAGDEEGTATITVKIAVIYSKTIVYATGEDGIKGKEETRGDKETKEVTKIINITIEPAEEKWKGTLSYTDIWDDRDSYRVVESYSGDINFTISDKIIDEPDTIWRVSGTADLSIDEISWSSYSEDMYCTNLIAPSNISLVVVGVVFNNYITIEIGSYISLTNMELNNVYSVDKCQVDSPDCYTDNRPIELFIGNEAFGDLTTIPLQEGIYESVFNIFGDPDNTVSYTISLQRDE